MKCKLYYEPTRIANICGYCHSLWLHLLTVIHYPNSQVKSPVPSDTLAELQAHQAVETVDIIHQSPKSALWRPFDSDNDIIFVSADNPDTQWVRFNGHFGIPLGQPSFTNATEVWGAALGLTRRAFVKTRAAAAAKMTRVDSGQPTSALGARHYIKEPLVHEWKHIHVFEEQDVVSSWQLSEAQHCLSLMLVTPQINVCTSMATQAGCAAAGLYLQ